MFHRDLTVQTTVTMHEGLVCMSCLSISTLTNQKCDINRCGIKSSGCVGGGA